ncbi:MAG: heavy metal translocating P-type ATPase [Cardiobacteriaceae bacterium]|nr:heavy metal translocating P-type ATPase [Cardiobacteriaceae bacterium]
MLEKARFQIAGMTCQVCANRIERVLVKKAGIVEVGVNFASEEAQVRFEASQISAEAIAQMIGKVGYTAIQVKDVMPLSTTRPQVGWRLWLLLLINIPFVMGMVGMFLGQPHWMLAPWWQFVLASVVQLWLAIPFYQSAWASIRGGLANMDVLVTLGTFAIYLFSVAMLFFSPHRGHAGMPHVYFEAGVMVVGFVSFGKYLEQRTKQSSLNSLELLLKLTPRTVQVLRDDVWCPLPLDAVLVGDKIRANAGERIAADGIVETGSGWVDESHLTGESRAEAKEVGSHVLAGALMQEGSIVYRATQLGSQTQLGDMMSALSEAQGSKAPIARIADKVAGIFVPLVVMLSLLTFVLTGCFQHDWEHALVHAVSVLVIACPCALGLATPAAIMVGMGKAVQHGIWFKDAAAIEAAARVNTVVLDKTGTLTRGEASVTASWCDGDTDAKRENIAESLLGEQSIPNDARYRLLRLAATVEQYATHPLARAVVQAARARNIAIPTAQQVRQVAGAGVEAEVEGVGIVKVGKADYCGLTLPAHMVTQWQNASIVAVTCNEAPVGALAVCDTLREDSMEAVQRLQSHGMAVYIMSGDHQSVVADIAAQLAITHAYGDMNPREKAAAIQQLEHDGKTVAMVGDGINDAPALALATVSFAMQHGADVAMHTASVTLTQHSINDVANALLIARVTLRNIKQNLFFAFIYNLCAIPIAAFGYLNPMIAAATMAASSLSVLSNALRLKQSKLD